MILAREREWLEFRPRPSRGRWWAGGLGVFVLASFTIPFVPVWGETSTGVIASFMLLGVIVSMLMLVPAWYYPEIRYRIGPREIQLSYGPLMDELIPLGSITSIVQKDLRISPWASFRFPGLALFDVHYLDEQTVRMCSTSASTRIVLIETPERKYGITPADEETFFDAIRLRTNGRVAVEETSYAREDHRPGGHSRTQ